MNVIHFSASKHRPHQRRLEAQRRPDAATWDTGFGSLSNETVLPAQFFPSATGQRLERPEAALMLAVLEDALACFQHGFVSGTRRAHRLAREAKAWFSSDDDHWLFSFVSICAALGLEPSYIRREVTQWEHGRPLPARRKSYRCVGERRQIAA